MPYLLFVPSPLELELKGGRCQPHQTLSPPNSISFLRNMHFSLIFCGFSFPNFLLLSELFSLSSLADLFDQSHEKKQKKILLACPCVLPSFCFFSQKVAQGVYIRCFCLTSPQHGLDATSLSVTRIDFVCRVFRPPDDIPLPRRYAA
jgi:hypothetical protein